MNKDEQIVVSVCMTTYNRDKYVEKALDSVLMQECDFRYEIVIGDDYSTDDTRAILLRYKEKYPDKIRLNFRTKNLKTFENGTKTFLECTGEYIAMLDSDDYWQDPTKLQKQVNFLEKHHEYSVSYHDSDHVDENDKVIEKTLGYREDYTSEDLISGTTPMPTSATIFRNMDIKIADFFYELTQQPDVILLHFAGFFGKAKFQDDIKNSAYRIHSSSVWGGIDRLKKVKKSVIVRRVARKNLKEHKVCYEKLGKEITGVYLNYLFVFLRDGPFSTYRKLWQVIFHDKDENTLKMLFLHIKDSSTRMFHKIIK